MRIDFQSLGLGVQSTALYFQSSMGELPPVEAAIFADLGREKKKTLLYLDFLMNWQAKNDGLPIIIVRKKNLYQDLLTKGDLSERRFSSIPAYTKGAGREEGMLRRQCTLEYKIEQVDIAIREYMEMSNLRGQDIGVWKGISTDEWPRMKNPEQLWKTHIYPFTGYAVTKNDSVKLPQRYVRQMSRVEIIAWYKSHGLPIPPKSSCVFCPYQSDEAWIEMKDNDPDDFEAACLVDEAIRDSSDKGITNAVYLHQSLVPLREVKFNHSTLWHGECSGECHT